LDVAFFALAFLALVFLASSFFSVGFVASASLGCSASTAFLAAATFLALYGRLASSAAVLSEVLLALTFLSVLAAVTFSEPACAGVSFKIGAGSACCVSINLTGAAGVSTAA